LFLIFSCFYLKQEIQVWMVNNILKKGTSSIFPWCHNLFAKGQVTLAESLHQILCVNSISIIQCSQDPKELGPQHSMSCLLPKVEWEDYLSHAKGVQGKGRIKHIIFFLKTWLFYFF
jgi:hypothetical protein